MQRPWTSREVPALLEVLEQIPPDELLRLRNTLTAYLVGNQGVLSETSAKSGQELSEESMMLDSLLETLENLGKSVKCRKILMNSRTYKANWGKAELVARWASQVGNRLNRRALYVVSFRHLHDYLRDGLPTRWDPAEKRLVRFRNKVIGVREMLLFLDYVPAVMEASYPGYADSGLLGMIVKSEYQEGRKQRWGRNRL